MNNVAEALTCSVCLGQLSSPRRLPCSHYFCLTCLELIVNRRCPECREAFHQDPKHLPSDYKLQQVLEAITSMDDTCSSCCEKVDKVEKCSHCQKGYCPVCHIHHWRGLVSRQLLDLNKSLDGKLPSELGSHCKRVTEESLRNARAECHRRVNRYFDQAFRRCQEKYQQTDGNLWHLNAIIWHFKSPHFSVSSRNGAQDFDDIEQMKRSVDKLTKGIELVDKMTGDTRSEIDQLLETVVNLLPGNLQDLQFPAPKAEPGLDPNAGTQQHKFEPPSGTQRELMNDMPRVERFPIPLPPRTRCQRQLTLIYDTRHQCISSMYQYAHKSLEELRWEDYRLKDLVRDPSQNKEWTEKRSLQPLVFHHSDRDQATQTNSVIRNSVEVQTEKKRHTRSKQQPSKEAYPKLESRVASVTSEFCPYQGMVAVSVSGKPHVNLDLYLLSQHHPTKSSCEPSTALDHSKMQQLPLHWREKLAGHPLFGNMAANDNKCRLTTERRNVVCACELNLYVWESATATLHRFDLTCVDLGVVSLRCDDPPVFTITDLAIKEDGDVIALYGSRGVACMWLNTGVDQSDTNRVDTRVCRGTLVDVLNGDYSLMIQTVAWQPGHHGNRLFVLLSDARFLVYDVAKDETMLDHQLMVLSVQQTALGECPVSFDIGPTKYDMYQDSLVQRILLLLGNGNVQLVDLHSYPKDVVLLDVSSVLRVEPSGLELDSCLDASKILTLPTTPTSVVIATTSGVFYHCILAGTWTQPIVSVLEMLEIDSESHCSGLRLLKEESGYLISHDTGIYRVSLPWLRLLGDPGNLSEAKLDETSFKVEQVSSVTDGPVQGFASLPDGDVIVIRNDYVCQCFGGSGRNETESSSFLDDINQLISKPKLNLLPYEEDPNKEISTELGSQIIIGTIASLKTHYVSKLKSAQTVLEKKVDDLNTGKEKQNEQLSSIEKTCSGVLLNRHAQEQKLSLILFRHKQLLKRILSLSHCILTTNSNIESSKIVVEQQNETSPCVELSSADAMNDLDETSDVTDEGDSSCMGSSKIVREQQNKASPFNSVELSSVDAMNDLDRSSDVKDEGDLLCMGSKIAGVQHTNETSPCNSVKLSSADAMDDLDRSSDVKDEGDLLCMGSSKIVGEPHKNGTSPCVELRSADAMNDLDGTSDVTDEGNLLCMGSSKIVDEQQIQTSPSVKLSSADAMNDLDGTSDVTDEGNILCMGSSKIVDEQQIETSPSVKLSSVDAMNDLDGTSYVTDVGDILRNTDVSDHSDETNEKNSSAGDISVTDLENTSLQEASSLVETVSECRVIDLPEVTYDDDDDIDKNVSDHVTDHKNSSDEGNEIIS